MKLSHKGWLAVVAGALVASSVAFAADHLDGPAVTADPAADITDLFAWMTDASHIALVMNVTPFATAVDAGTGVSSFSNAVAYVFHTTSHSGFLGTSDPEIDVVCTFDTSGAPTCWIMQGTTVLDSVSGTAAAAGSATGITSTSGNIQLFAGPRNDPFFFNLVGFQTTIGLVQAAVPGLVDAGAFNAAGCPSLPAATAQALATQLGENSDGGPAMDTFAGADVLSIVLNINSSALLKVSGDTTLSVWASTNSIQ